MISQIESSIGFDDMSKHYSKKTELLTGAEWLLAQKEDAIKDISYYDKKYSEDVDMCRKRSKWIQDLRESL
jgi:hypothetical protein